METPKPKLCNDSNVNGEYTPGAALPKKEGLGDKGTLSRDCSAFLLAYLAMKRVKDECRSAGWVFCERTELLANFILERVRVRSHCRFRTAFIPTMLMTQDVHTVITCFTVEMSIAYTVLQQYGMRLEETEPCLICDMAGLKRSSSTDMNQCEEMRDGVL